MLIICSHPRIFAFNILIKDSCLQGYLTDIFHKTFFGLLGRFSQYFIAVFADIETKKIKTVMDIGYIL